MIVVRIFYHAEGNMKLAYPLPRSGYRILGKK